MSLQNDHNDLMILVQTDSTQDCLFSGVLARV